MNAIAPEVDPTLIAEMLRLTPEQRVDQNDQMLAMIEELRRGLAPAQEPADDARRG